MAKRLDVLMVFDYQVPRPRGYDFSEEFKNEECRVYDAIYKALKNNGHRVRLLSIHDDIRPLIDEITEKKPDIVFNVADVFNNNSKLDKNIAWILEMMGVVYTGGTPPNLLLCNNKAISKKILIYHKIKVPHFYTFYKNKKIKRPRTKVKLPLIIKPLCEEASRGISMASIVDNDESLIERVNFIHNNMSMDAIAEEYIEGREFYVSIFGDKRITVLPIREMKFGQIEEERRIATYKAKWDLSYRKKWGVKNVFAGKLPEGWDKKIIDTCKRAYRAFNLKCYARFDIRVTPDGQVYIIEANLNPSLEKDDEFERSANKAGIPFEDLIEKILMLAYKGRR